MFCPKCHSEFEPGYTHCGECDVDLVDTLPVEEEEYTEVAAVFEGDAEAASVVRSRLEGAGIEAWIAGENARGVFPNLSPVTVRVRAEDEAQALQVLEDVVEPCSEDEGADGAELDEEG